MAAWLDDLNVGPGVRVSVNLSCRQVQSARSVRPYYGHLAETGLPADRLSLEVTEGVLMENVDNAVLLLNRLRAKNIGLQLDDFGTGYSSLSYLRRLPFDGLKIDKSFVHEMGLRQENVEIVGTIALLARTLGMTVLAEGVETHEQIEMLIGAGCDEPGESFLGRGGQRGGARLLRRVPAQSVSANQPAGRRKARLCRRLTEKRTCDDSYRRVSLLYSLLLCGIAYFCRSIHSWEFEGCTQRCLAALAIALAAAWAASQFRLYPRSRFLRGLFCGI